MAYKMQKSTENVAKLPKLSTLTGNRSRGIERQCLNLHRKFINNRLCMCSTTVAENSRKCDYMLNFGSKKGKVFPYSLPSVGPGADPGVQAVSPQVT